MILEAAPPVNATSAEETLLLAIAPLQARLAAHPLYRAIRTVEALRLFMESHVYAVWDFMSLLKSLQRALTCVEVPWRPQGDPTARRLVNEIVLGEESDVYEGEAISHFELYLRAMEGCGAATGSMRALLASNRSLESALDDVPHESAAFVRSTFAVIATGKPHRVAAAFTFGREDLIPAIFPAFVRELDEQMPGKVSAFRYYLERHIEMDSDEHGPMALRMIRSLCPDQRAWAEAQESAIAALTARLALWDGILRRIQGAM